MRATALIAAALLVAIASASDVVDIKDATFDSVIAGHSFVMVEFFAPWCGHCKRLEPEWEAAASQLKDVAVLAKLDATVEEQAARRYEIRGFPTIKIFRDGALHGDYEGGRTAADIVKYVKGNVGPAVNVVTSASELDALKQSNSVVAVLFSTTPVAAFESAAKALRSTATFVHVTEASAFGAEAAGSVVLYKSFDDGREVLSGDISDESVRAFVQNGSIRIFDEIGPENYKMYMQRKLPMAWLFVVPGQHDDVKEATAAAAKSFKGKISFVWIDASKYGQMAQRLGLKGDKWPALAIDLDQVHFAFDENTPITTAGVVEFTEKYLAGTLTATIRSEAAPAEPTVNGLTTVVGSTFEDIVVKSDKDVLIEFYAPWCGHCKSLKPIYEKVAEAVKDASHLTVAMIDATANDFDHKLFPVQGFPTLFFVPKGTPRTPVAYEGERTYDAFIKFLKEKSSAPINVAEAGDEL